MTTTTVTYNFALGTAVADEGTVAVAYPAGTVQADFTSGNASATGVIVVNGNDIYLESAAAISISYGASTITITNDSEVTWAAGSDIIAGFGRTVAVDELVTQSAIASLGGALTGSIDGDLADVADIALSTSDTYTDTAVNTAINAAILSVNLQLKELQAKQNETLVNLRSAGVIAAS